MKINNIILSDNKKLLTYNNIQYLLDELNPIIILNNEQMLINYFLNKNNNIVIKIDKENIEITKKYLIPGNKELKLTYKYEKNAYDQEIKYGIIKHNLENCKYGKYSNNIPTEPNKIIEPIRLLIDKELFNQLKLAFKKLIFIDTYIIYTDYIELPFNELFCYINNYERKYNPYKTNDLLNRDKGLCGKYYDALNLYQKVIEYKEIDINHIDFFEKELVNWYIEYLDLIDKLANDIISNLKIIFPNDKCMYYFQNKHPIRFSYPNTSGTPIHQDTQSLLINKKDISNYKNCVYEPINYNNDKCFIEVEQDKYIFNFNYSIFEDDDDLGLRICTHQIENMNTENTYFYRIKKNVENEGFLFNPSNILHFRPEQYQGYSIRGDLRIISIKNYNNTNLQEIKGPRINLNVCFGTQNDCKSSDSKFNVFMDKIYK